MKKLIALSGASSCGKTTILHRLDDTSVAGSQVSVMTSVTTRDLRYPNEPYRRCISREKFEELRPLMAQCITFGENSYGILRTDIDAALEKGIAFVDVVAEGVSQLKARYPNTVQAIFLYVHPRVLMQRLQDRNATRDEIRHRMELSATQLFDAIASGHYIFIENIDLERTLQTIENLLLGYSVEAIIPSCDIYVRELKAVMAEWENTGVLT